MNAERLKALADAYGADPRRWPEGAREAALAFMGADPARAERLLFEARQTDLALDASTPPHVSHALRERVIALAATAGLKTRRPRFGLGGLAWFSGAGWAAACAAGVIAGMNLSSPFVTAVEADAVFYQAALEAMDDTEVLE